MTPLKVVKELHAGYGVPSLGPDSALDVADVGTSACLRDYNIALLLSDILYWRKLMSRDWVIDGVQSEQGHLDFRDILCDRAISVVFMYVLIAKHDRVDLLVKDVQSGPVSLQDVLVVSIGLLAEVRLQLRQLVVSNVLVKLDSDSLGVKTPKIVVEESRALW